MTDSIPLNKAGDRPTLKTIAYMTGLGVTTVSRALSDAPDISDATKSRVRTVAREIGYRPNRAGVRLRTGKTNVVSLVLNIEREILGATSHLVFGISEMLAETPYHLIVTPYDIDHDPLEAVRYVVETGSADGLVLSRTEPNDPRVQYLQQQGFPFVTHGRTSLPTHPFVDFDNYEYGKMAGKILADMGATRLALLGPPAHLNYAILMAAGLRETLDARDLMEVPIRSTTIDDTHDAISAEVARLMRSRHRPDGFVCASASSAIAATAGIEDAGLTVGTDVNLVVKESFEILQHFRPEIHVIREDFRAAGRDLARAILRTIDGAPAAELGFLHMPEIS